MLACGWVVIWVARMMFTPLYPQLSDFFGGASSTQLGAISSWYFLGYALMQIPSGLLVDRIGMRRVVIPGFLLFAFGTAVMVVARSLPALYLGNALAGVGSGTFYGIAYTITNTRVPAQSKSLATAIVNSGTAVGSGLGIASASSLVATGLMPWQTLAGITGALALAMVAVFARWLPQERAARTARTQGASGSAPEPTGADSALSERADAGDAGDSESHPKPFDFHGVASNSQSAEERAGESPATASSRASSCMVPGKGPDGNARSAEPAEPGCAAGEHAAEGDAGDSEPHPKPFDFHLVAACVLYFATLYLYYLISTWLPDFLNVERAFDGSYAGGVSTVVFLAGIPGALAFGRLADRHPHRQIALIVALEVAAALALVPLVFGRSAFVVALGAVAYGFVGKLAVEPLIISWLGSYTPPERMTTTFGIFNFCGMSASAFAPLVTGVLADALGSEVPGFLVAIAVLALGTAAFLAILAMCAKRAGMSGASRGGAGMGGLDRGKGDCR
ncbi:MAG: MFS transporter [Eggerthellaceae bacterium]